MERGTIVAGRYEVEALAGIGGMGTVFRARDRDGQPVAIKVLHPYEGPGQMDARFAREIALLHRLRHPHIVRYLHSGLTADGIQFLVLEWLEGTSLANRLRDGRLRIADALTLTERMASALGFAHAHGVVHRDVKPHNVFLPGNDVSAAKLLDFGVARWNDATLALTRPGTAFGTPAYMSPEQVRGDPRIDARADVFSLGCVLFECITGQPAFAAPNAVAALGAILFDRMQWTDRTAVDIPAPVEALLHRMLAKAPDDRLDDGTAVVEAIQQLRTAMPATLLGAPAPVRMPAHAPAGADRHLARVMASRLAGGSSDLDAPAPPRSGQPTAPTPFVGRRQEMRMLISALEGCMDEEAARVVLLCGAPGMGKTRLCTELLHHIDAHHPDVEIWSARGDQRHREAPLFLMARAICSAVGICGSEPAAELHRKLHTYVASRVVHAREVERLVTALGPLVNAAAAPMPRAPDAPPGRAALMEDPRLASLMHLACHDLLDAATRGTPQPLASTSDRSNDSLESRSGRRKRPLLLVLDDLQWGDRATIDLLDLALRNQADRPLLLLAIGRPEIHELFPDLWSQHDTIELKLGRGKHGAAAHSQPVRQAL